MGNQRAERGVTTTQYAALVGIDYRDAHTGQDRRIEIDEAVPEAVVAESAWLVTQGLVRVLSTGDVREKGGE